MNTWKILVHGGAGAIPKEYEKKYETAVIQAVKAGYDTLENGGSSIDAVVAAVQSMEDNEVLNAGRGSVVTAEGTIEMDAFIMRGDTMNAGGVAGITQVKNPIILARIIMEESKHVLFSREGGLNIAREHGLELMDESYFITERTLKRFEEWKKKQAGVELSESDSMSSGLKRDKYGTVGAVAIDAQGLLAAATSTGGVLGKQVGRIGDTPTIGTGTYASQNIAVSATGIGEYIMRVTLATRIEHYYLLHQNLHQAVTQALTDMKQLIGGEAGVITIDKYGNLYPAHTTKSMAWASIDKGVLKTFLQG